MSLNIADVINQNVCIWLLCYKALYQNGNVIQFVKPTSHMKTFTNLNNSSAYNFCITSKPISNSLQVFFSICKIRNGCYVDEWRDICHRADCSLMHATRNSLTDQIWVSNTIYFSCFVRPYHYASKKGMQSFIYFGHAHKRLPWFWG